MDGAIRLKNNSQIEGQHNMIHINRRGVFLIIRRSYSSSLEAALNEDCALISSDDGHCHCFYSISQPLCCLPVFVKLPTVYLKVDAINCNLMYSEFINKNNNKSSWVIRARLKIRD